MATDAEYRAALEDGQDAEILLAKAIELLLSALSFIDALTQAPILQGRTLGELDIAAIREALIESNGSQKEAAESLGITARVMHHHLRTLHPKAYADLLPLVRPHTAATKAKMSASSRRVQAAAARLRAYEADLVVQAAKRKARKRKVR